MGVSKLYDRLKRLKENSQVKCGTPTGPPQQPGSTQGKKDSFPPVRQGRDGADLFSGWEKVSEFVLFNETRRTIHLPGSIALPPFFIRGNRVLLPMDEGVSIPISRLFFFDIETTGLSGGAGNVAFLFGCARFCGDTLNIGRFFLLDFPGEAEFLERLSSAIPEDAVYVTYNGRCFDEQVLRTRFLMNGLRFPARPHIDLLISSRRLWKRILPDCRLSTIETEILGVRRTEDIPGSEVPEAYFDFLKTGSCERLELVLSHNEEDVASLVSLLSRIDAVYSNPLRPWRLDTPRFGGSLFVLGIDEWEILLERDFLSGSLESGKRLSIIYKALGRLEKAVEIWRAIGEVPFALLELAKHAEHRNKDAQAALLFVETILRLPSGARFSDSLEKRKGRLLDKIAKSCRNDRIQ